MVCFASRPQTYGSGEKLDPVVLVVSNLLLLLGMEFTEVEVWRCGMHS
jgi:hypothetical protein